MMEMPMNRKIKQYHELLLRPKNVSLFLSIITAMVILAHFFHLFMYYGYHHYLGIIDLNHEQNIPTLYSAFLLLFCGGLLYVISIRKLRYNEKHRVLWLILCFIFVFLAFDEYFRIHDSLREPVRNLLEIGKGSVFYFAWVLPYGILLIIFGAAYIGFLRDLPGNYRNLFFISGVIYVTGALVFEMLGATRAGLYPRSDYLYAFWTTMEEILELVGLMIFIYTLMSYIAEFYNGTRLKIKGFSVRFLKD